MEDARPIKRARTELTTTTSPSASQIRVKKAEDKYGRGKKIPLHNVKDKKLRGNLKSLEKKHKDATLKAKDAEILLENEGGFLETEGELERTYKVTQAEIQKHVAIQTAQMGQFQLKMDESGPYISEYSRNGRDLLVAGRKGHVATMNWRDGKLGCELQLGETVRDARWLHNNQAFAVAQKKYVYIYDSAGVELHVLKKHIEDTNMEYLPYHHLLATVGNAGYLKYQDITTGQVVSSSIFHFAFGTLRVGFKFSALIHPDIGLHINISHGVRYCNELWGATFPSARTKSTTKF